MTQTELAKKMSVSRETLNHWENNARELKGTQLLKLAQIFNVTCDYILSGVSTENVELYKQLGIENEAIEQLKEIYKERLQCLFPPPLLKSKLLSYMLSNKEFMANFTDRLLGYANGRLDDDKDSKRTGKPVNSLETDVAGYRLMRLMLELGDSFYTEFYKPFCDINTRKEALLVKNDEGDANNGDN